MRSLGEYILRDHKQAAFAAALCSLLPLIPYGYLFSWIGYVILGLVTLRKGLLDGLLVLIWLALPSVAFTILGNPLILLHDIIFSGVMLWLFAGVLRATSSWRHVLYFATWLSILAMLTLYLFAPDLLTEWEAFFKINLQQWGGQAQDKVNFVKATELIAQCATGLQSIAIIANNLINLAFARGWQAFLFNPGGFRQEFYQLRLGYLALTMLILATVGVAFKLTMALNILLVTSLPFFIAGISLLHTLIASKAKIAWLWLSIFYVSVILFFPYSVGLLVIAACADILWNFRKRLGSVVN